MNSTFQPARIIAGSGLAEIAWAISLGWVMTAKMLPETGLSFLPPLFSGINKRRLLQAHIDYLMMGGLQLAAAAGLHSGLLSQTVLSPKSFVYVTVFGSWMNATSFLIGSLMEEKAFKRNIFINGLVLISFCCTTTTWFSLLASFIKA